MGGPVMSTVECQDEEQVLLERSEPHLCRQKSFQKVFVQVQAGWLEHATLRYR